jgi:hypothetical protein
MRARKMTYTKRMRRLEAPGLFFDDEGEDKAQQLPADARSCQVSDPIFFLRICRS